MNYVLSQDIVFLGTASGYPSPDRAASGAVLRDLSTGKQWLFDCGEGTQIQAQKSPFVHLDQKEEAGDIEFNKCDTRRAMVNIYGPQGLRRFIRLALALSNSHMHYTYAVHELIFREEHCPPKWTNWASLNADLTQDPLLYCEILGRDIKADADGFWYNILDNDEENAVVYAMSMKHTIPSVGWLIIKPEKPSALCAETARSLGIPNGPLMGQIKRGIPVEVNGKIIEPSSVLKPPIRGNRIAVMGDTCDSSQLERLLHTLVEQNKLPNVVLDMLVHEATFEDEMFEDALRKGHSTPSNIVKMASRLNVRLLVLTHFSHRYTALDRDIEIAQPETSTELQIKRKAKERPNLKILLENAKSVEFSGEVSLADDLTLINVPKVPENELL